MKIKKVLFEGLIAVVLSLFMDLESRPIILGLMVVVQTAGFAAYFFSEKRHSQLSTMYSMCLVTFYIECGTQTKSTLLFMLYFVQMQIAITRNTEWSKFSLLLNTYALFRVCPWT